MLPYWGSPQYLFEATESVLKQTDSRWHLTVIDDCYPDATVPQYFDSLNHPQVTYIRNESNIGIIKNFQRCVDLSKSEYIVIMGSDDRLRDNYVSTILEDINMFPGIEIIQPGVATVDSAGNRNNPLADKIKALLRPGARRGFRITEGEESCSTLLTGDWLYWPSLVFKTETLRKNPFRAYEIILDLALVIDVLAEGGRILLDSRTVFEYRRHGESLSGDKKLLDGSRFAGEREYFRLAAKQMSNLGWRRASFAARLHATSRLHAMLLIPRSLTDRNYRGAAALVRHALIP